MFQCACHKVSVFWVRRDQIKQEIERRAKKNAQETNAHKVRAK